MNVSATIRKLRTGAKLTQERFAEIFGVSQQSVQKWESGVASPDLDKIVMMAKYFDLSLDAFILGDDNRVVEEIKGVRRIKPKYQNVHDWEFYSSDLMTEYVQSCEEGLDVEVYENLFSAVSMLPKNETKKKLGDILFEIVSSAKQRNGYKYVEPSDLEQIKNLRPSLKLSLNAVDYNSLGKKIHGAWMGRVCGCMLGKTVEGIRTDELIPFLKETGNYPMSRYILKSDLTDEIISKYKFRFQGRVYADNIDGMPVDDDTNYVVLAQQIINDYGRDFTPYNVAEAWLKY